ncbi:MAG: hypothetical protein EU535_08030, partial [Promethearchaeota archaeon]
MIVLHGTWVPEGPHEEGGRFFLWGESSETPPEQRRGRPPNIAPHPFQANREELLGAFDSINTEIKSYFKIKGCEVNVLYKLPSTTKIPQPSSSLVYHGNEADIVDPSKLKFKHWNVSGLAINHSELIKLLASFSERGLDTRKIKIGADLIYWSRVSKLFLELLYRQRFIPGYVRLNKELYTGWKLILDKVNDRDKLFTLINAMPPVCMAPFEGEKNGLSKKDYILDFLDGNLNRCIRDCYSSSRVRGKKDSLAIAWLESLLSGAPLRANKMNMKRIHEGVLSWTNELVEENKYTFRTCFRLEPPEGSLKDHQWRLHYYLQALDDLSLLLPAEKVWKESKETLRFINQKF